MENFIHVNLIFSKKLTTYLGKKHVPVIGQLLFLYELGACLCVAIVVKHCDNVLGSTRYGQVRHFSATQSVSRFEHHPESRHIVFL